MLKYCLNKWNQNKGLLEEQLKKDTTLNSCNYDYLVKLIVDFILNPGAQYGDIVWDSNEITVVDDGDYQGTQLFLIPRKTYQPGEYDYLMTYVGYGSCSGCDTLQAIQDWHNNTLTEKQVKDFMTLCKDLLTGMIKPYNAGWRHEEDFVEVTMEDSQPTAKKDLSDVVAEVCKDFTEKILALADEYGKDRNRHMKDVVLTLAGVNLTMDFSNWQIGGGK